MRLCRAALAVLALVALAACSTEEPPEPGTEPVVYTRIVTLAPNLTEMVFSAGAGDALVGVSAWSDFPQVAKLLPVIGDAFMVDREALAALQPDLLLAWKDGTPVHVIDELRGRGFEVEVISTNSIDDVSHALRRIGELAGTSAVADHIATEFDKAMNYIAERHSGAGDLRVFYQVSRRPLYTVNGEHFVSDLIELCGGSNIFSDLQDLAPTVDVEAVVDRDPEVLLTTSAASDDAFADWQRWSALSANRYQNHFRIPADAVSRATTRLVTAAEAICNALDEARANKVTAAAQQ